MQLGSFPRRSPPWCGARTPLLRAEQASKKPLLFAGRVALRSAEIRLAGARVTRGFRPRRRVGETRSWTRRDHALTGMNSRVLPVRMTHLCGVGNPAQGDQKTQGQNETHRCCSKRPACLGGVRLPCSNRSWPHGKSHPWHQITRRAYRALRTSNNRANLSQAPPNDGARAEASPTSSPYQTKRTRRLPAARVARFLLDVPVSKENEGAGKQVSAVTSSIIRRTEQRAGAVRVVSLVRLMLLVLVFRRDRGIAAEEEGQNACCRPAGDLRDDFTTLPVKQFQGIRRVG